jgi:hypothetical protein
MDKRTADDPAEGQTEYEVGAYLKQASPGDEIAIHETQGGFLRIAVTTITEIGAIAPGRLATAASSYAGTRWYIRTGRSCFYPKGQSHLILAADAVRRFAAEHPNGISTYRNAIGDLARLKLANALRFLGESVSSPTQARSTSMRNVQRHRRGSSPGPHATRRVCLL